MNEAVPETPEPLPSIGPTATLSTSEVIDEAVHAAEISNGEFMSAPGGSGYLVGLAFRNRLGFKLKHLL